MSQALNLESGLAQDYARIFYPDSEEPRTEVIHISLEDEDELTLRFDDKKGNEISIWMPADRLRQLLQKVSP